MHTIFTAQRLATDGFSTAGELRQDGALLCYLLERGPSNAIYPRIPAGTYELRARKDFGKAQHYGELYGWDRHPFIVEIVVPDRKYVEFHIGNTIEDTRGCPLSGSALAEPRISMGGHWEVTRSRDAYWKTYPVIRDALINGTAQWQVIDEKPGAVA